MVLVVLIVPSLLWWIRHEEGILAAEAWVHSCHQAYGVAYAIVRLSNVYARYDATDRLVPHWLRCCHQGEPMVI